MIFDKLSHRYDIRQAQLVKQRLRCVLVETRLIASLHTCRHLQTDIDFTPSKKISLYILRIPRKNNTFATDLQNLPISPLFENTAIMIEFNRSKYLQKLISYKHNRLVKIVTGARRYDNIEGTNDTYSKLAGNMKRVAVIIFCAILLVGCKSKSGKEANGELSVVHGSNYDSISGDRMEDHNLSNEELSVIQSSNYDSIADDKKEDHIPSNEELSIVHSPNYYYLDSIIGGRIENLSDIEIDSLASQARRLNIKTTPYKSVKDIKKEFDRINVKWNEAYPFTGIWTDVLFGRLEFHLSNPVTFQQWNGASNDPIRVSASPDGKYKFYTTWDICEGTMGEWVTYYQYIDSDGKLVCKEWQGDRRFDCKRNVLDVWQFDYHDSTFYVLKSVWQGSSREWGYNMEIVTFNDGVPQYHIHFFPGKKEYGEIKKVTVVKGVCVDESDWVKEDGAYGICYTYHALDVDYTFNPKTLTITATTQDEETSQTKVEKWKLKTD